LALVSWLVKLVEESSLKVSVSTISSLDSLACSAKASATPELYVSPEL